MAFTAPLTGRHGGGYDPSSGTFVLAQNYSAPHTARPHGGNFDPSSPFASPSVIIQPAPIAPIVTIPQTNPALYYTQPNQQQHFQYRPQQQYPQKAPPGIISQLCACFK
ncbi:hypothetical protein BKA63DRAFT_39296 [Paraphoma chrysanthemicola]|nr:hypothetical protein BKA63DRAFT_39296 [Paraphoma chrysanthemicola]